MISVIFKGDRKKLLKLSIFLAKRLDIVPFVKNDGLVFDVQGDDVLFPEAVAKGARSFLKSRHLAGGVDLRNDKVYVSLVESTQEKELGLFDRPPRNVIACTHCGMLFTNDVEHRLHLYIHQAGGP